jgi:REP element-mobilizing transposase RayT
LDIPGAIFHVIARGIERKTIFRDSRDYSNFLNRLGKNLITSQCRCYAWALLPNHLHLLLSPTVQPLSLTMHKIFTGYAGYFNRRHKRSGHLFQNRYKSILCQEDTYLLELVRYIHLNPLRAGIVTTLEALQKHPWTGHPILLGKKKFDWQETKEILSRFGINLPTASREYLAFVRNGLAMGRREDLEGGGLQRSCNGAVEKNPKELRLGDDRILGDSLFVELALKHEESYIQEKIKAKLTCATLETIMDEVCQTYKVEQLALFQKWRLHRAAKAKAIIAFRCQKLLGMKVRDIAKIFGLSDAGASLLCQRGKIYSQEELTSRLLKNLCQGQETAV